MSVLWSRHFIETLSTEQSISCVLLHCTIWDTSLLVYTGNNMWGSHWTWTWKLNPLSGWQSGLTSYILEELLWEIQIDKNMEKHTCSGKILKWKWNILDLFNPVLLDLMTLSSHPQTGMEVSNKSTCIPDFIMLISPTYSCRLRWKLSISLGEDLSQIWWCEFVTQTWECLSPGPWSTQESSLQRMGSGYSTRS